MLLCAPCYFPLLLQEQLATLPTSLRQQRFSEMCAYIAKGAMHWCLVLALPCHNTSSVVEYHSWIAIFDVLSQEEQTRSCMKTLLSPKRQRHQGYQPTSFYFRSILVGTISSLIWLKQHYLASLCQVSPSLSWTWMRPCKRAKDHLVNHVLLKCSFFTP